MTPCRTLLLVLLAGCAEPVAGTAITGTREVVIGPSIRLMPSPTLAFGPVSSARTRVVMIRNVGNAALILDKVELAGTDFTLGALPSTRVEPGSAIPLAVKLTPTSLGPKSGALTIHSNDLAFPRTELAITADAIAAQPCTYSVSPSRLSFTEVGELPVTILNTGGVCEISDISIDPSSSPAFVLVGGPVENRTLLEGQSLSAIIRLESLPFAITGTLRISVAASATTKVPLSASRVAGCLTISPDDLNFGTIQQQCSSAARAFTLYNTCSDDVTLVSYTMLSPAGEPAGGPNCPGLTACPEFVAVSTAGIPPNTVLKAGAAPATFTVKYQPINTGPDTGAFLLKVNQSGSMIDYLVTFSGQGDPFGVNTDRFKLDDRPKSDILIVLDSSSSMANKQASLAANFSSFVSFLEGSGVDYQLAVTTADLAREGGKIVGHVHNEKILTRTTVDVEAKFLQKIASLAGTGSDTEQILASAAAALSPQLLASDNAGLVRPDAPMTVLAVSDSDDESPLPVSTYTAPLRSVKRNAWLFSFSSVGPYLDAPLPGCTYDGLGGARRTHSAVLELNGVREELCVPDWIRGFLPFSHTPFGIRTSYFLTATPHLVNGNTITVKIDGVSVPAIDPRGANIWRYDAPSNAVNFELLFAPGPGQTVEISYRTACLP